VQPGIAFADRSHPDKRLVSEFVPLQYRPTVGWPCRFIDSKTSLGSAPPGTAPVSGVLACAE